MTRQHWDLLSSMTFPYSVRPSWQMWCASGEAFIMTALWAEEYRDRFHRLFPKVMPDYFCLQSIPLGKLRVIAHATLQLLWYEGGRGQWCALRRWIRTWKVLRGGWHKEISCYLPYTNSLATQGLGKHRKGNFMTRNRGIESKGL